MDPNSLAQLLSGVFSGAAGISQLGQAGTNAAAGASAASPFQSQYAQYQPQVQGQVTGAQSSLQSGNSSISALLSQLLGTNTAVSGNQNALNYASTLTGAMNQNTSAIAGLNPTVSGPGASQLASPDSLTSQINALSTNYMSNPAIQAQYQLGLNAVNRGQAASGTVGSGAQMAELEQYGQQYASGAYQQTFNDLVSGSNAAFNQQSTNTSQQQAAQQGTFSQGLQQQTSGAQITQQQIANLMGLNTAAVGQQQDSISNAGNFLSTALGAQNTANSTNANASQGILSSLEQLSGATTGSPATAGSILSGQFANTNTALGNLGAGITSAGSALGSSAGSLLSSLFSGSGASSTISNTLASLFGSGGTGALAQDTIDGLTSSLGSSTAGGFESLLAGGTDSGISSGLSALMGL